MSTLDAAELKRQIVDRARLDETFRKSLIADPIATIKKMAGDQLPEGFSFDPVAELGDLAKIGDVNPDDLGLGHGKM